MAVDQSAHRQDLERTVIHGAVAAEKRGQHYAFALGVLAIVGGVALVWNGKDAMGLVAIISALTSLTGVFIWGRWRQEKERDKKRLELENAQLPIPFDPPIRN